MMVKLYSFPSQERLKHRKKIESLFQSGKSFSQYPLRVVYSISSATEDITLGNIQIAFSVPKKKFKSAVDRNRIKRLMREAYRLQIGTLRKICEENRISLQAMLIFTSTTMPDLNQVLISSDKIWQRLEKELNA
jgi:ribonuclease P protein component